MSNMIEKSVIGALLIEPDSISGIYEQIKPEMFGDLFCRSVYTEIVRAYDVGKSISLEELAQKLQSEGQTQEYIVQELRGIIPTESRAMQMRWNRIIRHAGLMSYYLM